MANRRFTLFSISFIVFNTFVLLLPGARIFPGSPVTFLEQAPYFFLLPLNAVGLFYLLRKQSEAELFTFKNILLLLIFSRLLLFLGKLMTSSITVDWDIERFFLLGSELSGGHFPLAEYPPFAVFYFAFLNILSWNRLEIFRFVFPWMNLLFEIGSLYFLIKIAKEFGNETIGKLLSVFYIINPFLSIFWLSKFDIMPVFFLLASVYFLIRNRTATVALFLYTAILAKLFPAALIPAVLFFYLFNRKRKSLLVFLTVIFGISGLTCLLIFLLNKDALSYFVSFQGNRSIQAESIFFLPLNIFGSHVALSSGAPWDEILSSAFGNKKVLVIQGFLSLFTFSLFLISRKFYLRKALFGGILTLVVFLLFNKVFSPQFFLFLFFSYLVLIGITKLNIRQLTVILTFIEIASAANFFVWPLFAFSWLGWSFVFFICNIILYFYFLRQGLKEEAQ